MESVQTYDHSLDEAASFLGNYCRKWARLGGQTKEKYGTVRFYASFGYLSLHDLLYPGYHYNQFPQWLRTFDEKIFIPLSTFFYLQKPLFKWQEFIYGLAYKKAIKRWPTAEDALLIGADRPELIKGATRREGNKLHIINSSGSVIGTWVSV